MSGGELHGARMLRRAMLVATAASVLLASGCADDDDAGTTTTSAADPAVLIQFSTSTIGGPGGPVPEDLPELTAYDDRRVIASNRLELNGQVPTMFEATVALTELIRLLTEARGAGLLADQPPDPGGGGFEALPTTVVLSDGAATQTFILAGLDRDDEPDLTAEQRAVREATRRLRDQLLALAEGDTSSYAITELAAFASLRPPGARRVSSWPLDRSLRQGEPSGGLHERCVLLTGDDLSDVLEVAVEADTDRWSSGGENWIVLFRPLLPHEHECPTAG